MYTPQNKEDRQRKIGQWLPAESLLVLGKHIKAFMLVDFVSTPFPAQDPPPSTWQASGTFSSPSQGLRRSSRLLEHRCAEPLLCLGTAPGGSLNLKIA